uniref:NADH-ubiquinone oxidoreductase chain 3 n=1 Tax=Scelimena sp. 1 XDL-2023a TaxID=3071528 RepID=A0AA50NRP3_9ORTH|nr:NADH dehydrogenase subunit 3 [Scelimena sp. 1 XDL-2023a]
MQSTLTAIMISIMITILMTSMSLIISKKTILDQEKSSPFECGFNPQTNARLPFSIQFFLISMLFLIFDIEIALLLPLIPVMSTSNLMIWMTSFSAFMIILLVGLFYEWQQGMLKWAS